MPDRTAAPRQRPARKPAWRRIAILILSVVLLAAWWPFAPLPASYNVLILGVDARQGDVGRSDTLMVAGLRRSTKRLTVVSIPRDTRVAIPGRRGEDKVNAAYAYGGTDLTVQTVEQFAGVELAGSLRLTPEGLARIIDALGGMTIQVDRAMDYDDPYQDLHIHLRPGIQHLNGEGALGYVRFRGDPRGDIARVERQQKFLVALTRQVLLPGTWPRLPAALAAVREAIEARIPPWTAAYLLLNLPLSAVAGVETITLPGAPRTLAGTSYWIPGADADAVFLVLR